MASFDNLVVDAPEYFNGPGGDRLSRRRDGALRTFEGGRLKTSEGDLLPFNDLERDGYIHKTEVEYDFRLGPGISLTPGFELSIGDIDGEANAYMGYRFGLGFRKFSKSYQLMLKAAVGWDDYDDKHPVFSKTRNDTNYSVFGMFTRSDLFGQDYLFATLMAGYRYRDSNIGFLNAQTFLSGAMIGVEF